VYHADDVCRLHLGGLSPARGGWQRKNVSVSCSAARARGVSSAETSRGAAPLHEPILPGRNVSTVGGPHRPVFQACLYGTALLEPPTDLPVCAWQEARSETQSCRHPKRTLASA